MKKWLLMLALCLLLPLTALADALPVDFSAGPVAKEENYTETGYQDETLTVEMSRVWVGNACYNMARVKIADASQLRTALAASFGSSKTNKVSTLARTNNAVVAIGGDYYNNRTKGFVVRQGEVYTKTRASSLDMLCIDDKGDFHILPQSDPTMLKELVANTTLVNVFNFGPALVIDSVLQEIPSGFQFNPNGKEPRCAIGQLGELEYLLVVVDGRDAKAPTEDGGTKASKGCTIAELAQFMADQGCVQAFNLDGGNSALMVFHGENYSSKSFSAERSVSDIIYIATGVIGE